jgi:hypothetical protein
MTPVRLRKKWRRGWLKIRQGLKPPPLSIRIEHQQGKAVRPLDASVAVTACGVATPRAPRSKSKNVIKFSKPAGPMAQFVTISAFGALFYSRGDLDAGPLTSPSPNLRRQRQMRSILGPFTFVNLHFRDLLSRERQAWLEVLAGASAHR